MTTEEERITRVQAGSRRKRDLASTPAPRQLSAEEKYLDFFARWRERTGRPHSIEKAWRRDYAEAVQAIERRSSEAEPER